MKKDIIPGTLVDFREILTKLPGPDLNAVAATGLREPQLTKPPGSLGKLEEIVGWLASWQGRHPPAMEEIAVRVFAGNHGIVKHGVSAYPQDVTQQMVTNFKAGGAAINQLCAATNAELQVIPIDLDRPTRDFSKGSAMDEPEFMDAIRRGIDSVPENTDLLCVGEMGIGNTTSASALCFSLFGGNVEDWTGPGTGVTGKNYQTKIQVVSNSVRYHAPLITDGLDTLQRLGGRELAAMAGAIIGARLKYIPVILDGFVAGAAASTLKCMHSDALSHCLAAHVSAEPGHKLLLEKLSMPPLLNLNMRLGEASGATLAVGIIKAAVSCHSGMATFTEAGVNDKT